MKIRKCFICLFAFLLLAISLSGCGQPVQTEATDKDAPSMFVVVENAGIWLVVYHKDTKVMYAVSYGNHNSGNFNLLVNPDGSPMLWTGDEQ